MKQSELKSFIKENIIDILSEATEEEVENQKELISKIENIEEASVEDGGSGAFYIFLKKKL